MLTVLAVIASLHAVNVPDTFGGDKIDGASVKADLPVLIPQTIRSEFKTLYPDVVARKGNYALTLGAAKHCFGANACSVAYFGADKGGTPVGDEAISLANGITGRFTPTHCGGSCAPPQIEWKQNGAVYNVSVKGFSEKREKRDNRRAANSAIRRGARYND